MRNYLFFAKIFALFVKLTGRRDSGLDGSREDKTQERRDEGQERCWTVDRWDAGQVGCRTGEMLDRTDAGQERCWTGRMQDRKDAGQERNDYKNILYNILNNIIKPKRNKAFFLGPIKKPSK